MIEESVKVLTGTSSRYTDMASGSGDEGCDNDDNCDKQIRVRA